jgi:hypothetical protein
VNYLFTNILNKETLTHFNFNHNTFIDDVKEGEYSIFINRYRDTEHTYKYELLPPLIVMRIKTHFLLEWVCNNNEITQNPDSYIYKKWLEWLVYKKVRKIKDIVIELGKIDTDDTYVEGLNVDKTTEYYKEFIKVWNTPNNKEFYLQTEGFYRAFYEGMNPEEMGFYKSLFVNDKYYMDLAKRTEDFYKRFNEDKEKEDDEYKSFLLKIQKEEKYKLQISSDNKQPYNGYLLKSAKPNTEEQIKKKDWFKWLLSNNTVAGIKLDTKYDDIIERLFIVIEGFKNAFDEKIKGLKNIDDYDSFLICLTYSVVISFDEKVMENIIKEFDKLVNIYNPNEYNLTRKYNDIIADRVNNRTNGKITTFATSQITKELRGVSGVSGGRKTKSKSRKQPKKSLNKPPKKTREEPKKPTKKVTLKEPNVYGVIKHKIRI